MSIYDTLNPEQKEAVLQTGRSGFNFMQVPVLERPVC